MLLYPFGASTRWYLLYPFGAKYKSPVVSCRSEDTKHKDSDLLIPGGAVAKHALQRLCRLSERFTPVFRELGVWLAFPLIPGEAFLIPGRLPTFSNKWLSLASGLARSRAGAAHAVEPRCEDCPGANHTSNSQDLSWTVLLRDYSVSQAYTPIDQHNNKLFLH